MIRKLKLKEDIILKVTKEKNEVKDDKILSNLVNPKKTISSKSIVSKKSNSRKSSTKISTKIKKDSSKNIAPNETSSKDNAVPTYQPTEYYDLPYRYNQTVIKILAQTPHALFIYWDISDADRQDMIKKYGENFFNETKPVLLVHNKTLNSSFEIKIDDFTNSWYLRTPTSDCVFNIELGRKKIANDDKINFENNSNYLHIVNSNTIKSPNDHILKDSLTNLYFKNVKTNEFEQRDVSNLKQTNIYQLIDLYSQESQLENNPSSGFKIS